MKKNRIGIILVVFLFSLHLNAVTIKFGSLAPTGSPWDLAVKEIAQEWKKITNGKVKIKIYPGGIAGTEQDMIRKMRIGQLGGATLTGAAMASVVPEIMIMSVPMVLKSNDELYYLMEKIGPKFEQLMSKKGLVVIAWSNAGWIKYFTKKPIKAPEDLMKMKLATSPTDAESIQVLRKIGFNVIPLASTDMMAGLSSGMVDAFYAPTLVAAAFQWFGVANQMLDLKLSPLVGSIVISKRIWKKIPEKYHKSMLEVTKKMGKKWDVKTLTLEKEAMKLMQQYGLKINPVSTVDYGKWENIIKKGQDEFVGRTFSKEFYMEVQKHLLEFRKNNGK